ncbi:arf-GAP with dual PH domain-containing protein 2 isoform X9 [Oryctolagus cuniculus]|uniref:arf-GAP with dual PH domain-containing protein 2 isoform X9 n=1 Tax=Oryctolagus cuniculus TaxID=9986 RepID=UPI0038790C7F
MPTTARAGATLKPGAKELNSGLPGGCRDRGPPAIFCCPAACATAGGWPHAPLCGPGRRGCRVTGGHLRARTRFGRPHQQAAVPRAEGSSGERWPQATGPAGEEEERGRSPRRHAPAARHRYFRAAMAGPGCSPAVPVWLTEDDLGCIICHGLLSWPVTLPCGHSFCRHCLTHLWDSRDARRRWACPTCREGAAQPPRLRKNTLLQDLADKYSRAARELDADPAPAARAAPPRVVIPKSLTEVGEELTGLVQQLVDIVRSLQSQRRPLEPGPDGGLSAEGAWKSQKLRLPLRAPCLTRTAPHPRGPLGLLNVSMWTTQSKGVGQLCPSLCCWTLLGFLNPMWEAANDSQGPSARPLT